MWYTVLLSETGQSQKCCPEVPHERDDSFLLRTLPKCTSMIFTGCILPHGIISDVWAVFKYLNSILTQSDRWIQEGQHPLTGQRATNFRLLANQWAKHRLVTQWSYGCRAMRRSVCNRGASNAGRSLCVQIWRGRSYPLPIYWYHSRGSWLRYNFAADSFYIMLIFALDKLNIRHISTSGLVDLLT